MIQWIAFSLFLVGILALFCISENGEVVGLDMDFDGITQLGSTDVFFSGIVMNAQHVDGGMSFWVETSCDVHVSYFEEVDIGVGDFVSVIGVVEGDKFVRAYSIE